MPTVYFFWWSKFFLLHLNSYLVVTFCTFLKFPIWPGYFVNFIRPPNLQLNSGTFLEKNNFDPGSGFLSGFRFLYFWWLYSKDFTAYELVLRYWFTHKIFWFFRDPDFCPVSGFCTSNGHIQKISMQVNLYWQTNSSIKFSGWSGVRISVRFPVFVLLVVIQTWKLDG